MSKAYLAGYQGLSSVMRTVKKPKTVPLEKAFHFYDGADMPTEFLAASLSEFLDCLEKVGTQSLEFHLQRGDFQKWVALFDEKRIIQQLDSLAKKGLKGEKLRAEMIEILKARVRKA